MEEIRRENQLSLVVYPMIYKVLYIPGGFLAGFLKHPTSGWCVFQLPAMKKSSQQLRFFWSWKLKSKKGKSATVIGKSCDTSWWFQIFFIFHPYLGKILIVTDLFQVG